MATTPHHGRAASGQREYFTCGQHQKLAYPRRDDARAAARRLYDRGVREYGCSAHPGCWHIGHMPPCVRRGEMTATEFYDLPKRQQARRWAQETAEGPGTKPGPSATAPAARTPRRRS
jgi:hypothetical protein